MEWAEEWGAEVKERDRRREDERGTMKTGVNEQSDNVKRERDCSSKDEKTLTSNYSKSTHSVEQKNTKAPVKMKAGNINVPISQKQTASRCAIND